MICDHSWRADILVRLPFLRQYAILVALSLSMFYFSFSFGQVRQPKLKMIEEVWVPDSVFSPYMGIDFDYTVWKWRWSNGLTDEKPFDTWEQEEEAIRNGTYLPPKYVPPSDDYLAFDSHFWDSNGIPVIRAYWDEMNSSEILSFESHFWDSKDIADIRAYLDETNSWNDKIWIVEEIIKPTDEDTAGACLMYGSPWNSRYRLIVQDDTVMTFKACSSGMGSQVIVNARSWEGGYSFTYQEASVPKFKLHTVLNGKDLNENGYQNTLGCTFLDEKLFYIFQKNGKWGWSFDAVDHPDVWDDVYFHYGDGERGPNDDPNWKGISALRNGMWYMVRFEKAE